MRDILLDIERLVHKHNRFAHGEILPPPRRNGPEPNVAQFFVNAKLHDANLNAFSDAKNL
jgi:hypothetical protein